MSFLAAALITAQLGNIGAATAVGIDTFRALKESDHKLGTGLCLGVKYGGALAIVETVKTITHKERPDHSDFLSFPSGHTAVASAGWSLGFSIPLGAFVGEERIRMRKHDIWDVLGGAGVGLGMSYLTRGCR